MQRFLKYLKSNLYLDVWVVLFFLLSFGIEPILGIKDGFVFDPIRQVFKGYVTIICSSSILITDYVYIAGLGATFFNVATILMLNLLLIKKMKIRMNGPVYAGVVMICGFSFFGKNLFNTLPIYLGIYLFSLFRKIPYKSCIIALLFSTGISPLVSYCFFGFGLPPYYALPLGIFCGMLAGFLIPAFSSHTLVFHEGFNLYNTGFALGVLSALFYAFFNFIGWDVKTVELYDYSSSLIFHILLPVLSLVSIFLAAIGDKKVFQTYRELWQTSGRLVTDYVKEFKEEAVLLNFGLIGLLLSLISFVFFVPMNGIIFGSALSILGFAGFGLHIRNVLPVWIGAGVAIGLSMLIQKNYTLEITTIVAFVFASGLAPISGRYGFVYGFVGGLIHIILTPLMILFQGGFDLYNNGFSAGFEAAILCVVAEKVVGRGKRYARESESE